MQVLHIQVKSIIYYLDLLLESSSWALHSLRFLFLSDNVVFFCYTLFPSVVIMFFKLRCFSAHHS